MKIYIKNMVCGRCCLMVRKQLEELSIPVSSICLGVIDFGDTPPSSNNINLFEKKIKKFGFEIIYDKKSRLVEKTKNSLTMLISNENFGKVKLSTYLQNNLFKEYSYLSSLFSMQEGQTIEQYYIKQKIEKVKEYLSYDEMSLTKISCLLGYSSVAHLSAQFKKITGVNPTNYRSNPSLLERKSLDKA